MDLLLIRHGKPVLATTLVILSAYAVDWGDPVPDPRTRRSAAAPSVVTGDNIYIAWWNGYGMART